MDFLTSPAILFDLVGLLGVGAILLAYLMIQTGRMASEDPIYSALNAVGSAGVLISLVRDFNLPSAVVESFWFLISLYGLFKVGMRARGGKGKS